VGHFAIDRFEFVQHKRSLQTKFLAKDQKSALLIKSAQDEFLKKGLDTKCLLFGKMLIALAKSVLSLAIVVVFINDNGLVVPR